MHTLPTDWQLDGEIRNREVHTKELKTVKERLRYPQKGAVNEDQLNDWPISALKVKNQK